MNKIKKAFIIALIALKMILIVAGVFFIVYSTVTKRPIRELIDYDLWLFFFVFDMWTNNFTAPKLTKDKE